MPRPSIVASVLLVAFAVGFWPLASAYPPPPPTRKELLGKLHKVQADMNKLQSDEATELGKIYNHYAPLRGKAAGSLNKLRRDMAKLHNEEWTELSRAIDPAKVKAVKEKYAPQIADLEKQLKPKFEAMARMTEKRNDELARIESDWSIELAKLDAPGLKAAELRAKERIELHALIDPEKAKAIEADFAPQFADLEKKAKALSKAQEEANKKRLAEKAAAQEALQDQLKVLDPPEDRLEDQIAQLRAQRDTALADADTADKKKEVQAGFDTQIKAVQARVKELDQDMAVARHLALNQMAAADAAYWATLAKLDPPEDRLDARWAALHDAERTEIAKTADPAKVKAVHARYDAQIQVLEAKMQSREGEIVHLAHKKQEQEAKVIAAWYAQIMKVDPAQDALSYKLFVVKTKEQAELRKALDPGKEEAIRARFRPKFTDLQKKINDQEKDLSVLGQKQRDEMTKVIDRYNGKLTPMQKHAADLVEQIQKAKK
jgi:phage host-nuclease inhibitor protein Gam